MADHEARQIGRGHILHASAGNHHAVAQNRVAVADFHNLPQLMRDKDDAHLLFPQLTQDGEHLFDFRIGQRRRRLVHDDHLRVHQQRAADFHNLLVRRIQIAHHLFGIERQPHAFKNAARLLDHPFVIQKTVLLFQFTPDKHVFVNRQIIDEVQLLMDKRDARIQRLRRRIEFSFLPIQQNLARVRLQNAAQNIHQRRFSRAVFAKQRADFALAQLKAHGFEHFVGTERFADSVHFQFHGCPPAFGYENGLWLTP